MAARIEEIALGRIIACFAPGSRAAPAAVAQLARHARAELLALFIEDAELLRFAALPIAAEVGFPSAALRSLDRAAVERALRAQAQALRDALAAALDPAAHAWSFRVARASPASAVEAALAEGFAPSLLLPPGTDPRAARRGVRARQLSAAQLRDLIAAAQPVLVLPE
jgi:hypothetical protein